MKAHLIDTRLLVPRSRLSAKVKVKYKGYISQKMAVVAVWGIRVSQTHLVLLEFMELLDFSSTGRRLCHGVVSVLRLCVRQ